MMQDRVDRIQTSLACRQTEHRFMTKLVGQCLHVLTVDIRWIADNQFISPVAE